MHRIPFRLLVSLCLCDPLLHRLVDNFTRVRAMSLHALCLLDVKRTENAYAVLKKSFRIIRDVNRASEEAIGLSGAKPAALKGLDIPTSFARDRFLTKQRNRDAISGRSTLAISEREKMNRKSTFELTQTSPDELALSSGRRLEWTIGQSRLLRPYMTRAK